jgi:hypothetical protein
MNVLPYGQSRELQSDGTSWYETSASSGAAGFLAGHLTGANVVLPVNTLTDVLDTASLAPGTWEIGFIATMFFTDASVSGGAKLTVKSGTATLDGSFGAAFNSTGASSQCTAPLRCIATVTAAAVVELAMVCAGASGGFAMVGSTYGNLVMTNQTGYTAVQIA